jgi:hypothetical protein
VNCNYGSGGAFGGFRPVLVTGPSL